jgi:plasmid stability protein
MPTLYVENIPEDLYEALGARARAQRKSISAEVIELLRQNVPTAAEMARRKQLLELAAKIRSEPSAAPGPFRSAEEMQERTAGGDLLRARCQRGRQMVSSARAGTAGGGGGARAAHVLVWRLRAGSAGSVLAGDGNRPLEGCPCGPDAGGLV